MSDDENYFHAEPEVQPAGKRKRKAAGVQQEMPPPRLSRKTKQGQDRVLRKNAKKQAEEETKKNPFQSPNKAKRAPKVMKNVKKARIPRKAVSAPENETENLISPKRSRRQLAAELAEPDQSDEGQDGSEEDIPFEEEDTLEFMQELADDLVGDEDENQFSQRQMESIVTDEFTGFLMPFKSVLASRRKINQLFKEKSLFPPVNQVVISNAVQMKPMRDLTHDSFKRLEQEYELANASAPVDMDQSRLINSDLHDQLQVKFAAETDLDGTPWLEHEDDDSWKDWKPDLFFERIFRIYPSAQAGSDGTLQHKLQKLTFVLSEAEDFKSVNEFLSTCNNIAKQHGSPDDDMDVILRIILEKIKAGGDLGPTVANDLRTGPKLTSIRQLWLRWTVKAKEIVKSKNLAATYTSRKGRLYQNNPGNGDSNREPKGGSEKLSRRAQKRKANETKGGTERPDRPKVLCKGCGRVHPGECRLIKFGHPDANTSDLPWAESVKGRAWRAQGLDACDYNRTLDNKPFVCPRPERPEPKKEAQPKGVKHPQPRRQGKYDLLFAMQCMTSDVYTVPVAVHSEHSVSAFNCDMLIDTGALQDNYVSVKTAQWLSATQSAASEGQVGVVPPQQPIGRGDDSVCLSCKANTCGDQCFLLKPSVVKGKHKQQKSTPRRKVTSVKRHKKSLYNKADTNKSSANTRTRVCSGIRFVHRKPRYGAA